MDWHPEDIKAAVRKRGSTLSALAARNGMSTQALSRALDERSSARAEKVIADFLGVHPMKIWPSRYDKQGERLSLLAFRKVAA